MSMLSKTLIVAAVVAALATPAFAQFNQPWSDSLPAAQQAAASQRRLVLIHFWSESCTPCRVMEQTVFNRTEVLRALSSNYVAVKVNSREAPELAQRFGVNRIPADVIMTPDGQLVDRSVGSMTADQYIAMIDRTAALHRAGMPAAATPLVQSTTAYDPRTGEVGQYNPRNSTFVPRGAAAGQMPMQQTPMQQTLTQQTPTQQTPLQQTPTVGRFVSDQAANSYPFRDPAAGGSQHTRAEAAITPPYGQQYRPGSIPQDNPYIDGPARQNSQATGAAPMGPTANGQHEPRFAAGNEQPQYSPQTWQAQQAPQQQLPTRGGQFEPAGPAQGNQGQVSAYADAPNGGLPWTPNEEFAPSEPSLNQPENRSPAPGAANMQPPAISQTPPSENTAPPAQREAPQPGPSPADQQGPPPLALSGFCAVNLVEEPNDAQKWAKGDRRWGAIHRGRLYLFTGQEQQQRFLAAPDRYAPVLSGADVVNYVDEGRVVQGAIETGVFYGGRIFLFQSEENLRRFWTNPDHYSRSAESLAARAGVQPLRR